MAKTLTLDFSIQHIIVLRLKGLSFKALGRTDLKSDVHISDDTRRAFQIEVREWNIDGKTAKPKVEKVVEWLYELKQAVPFDKIKIKGHYHFTGDELMQKIIKHGKLL